MYADFLDSFWGATGFFNVMMQQVFCFFVFAAALLHKALPRKLTWNWKITPLKRKIIFQTSVFGFHVSFRGCRPCDVIDATNEVHGVK